MTAPNCQRTTKGKRSKQGNEKEERHVHFHTAIARREERLITTSSNLRLVPHYANMCTSDQDPIVFPRPRKELSWVVTNHRTPQHSMMDCGLWDSEQWSVIRLLSATLSSTQEVPNHSFRYPRMRKCTFMPSTTTPVHARLRATRTPCPRQVRLDAWQLPRASQRSGWCEGSYPRPELEAAH